MRSTVSRLAIVLLALVLVALLVPLSPPRLDVDRVGDVAVPVPAAPAAGEALSRAVDAVRRADQGVREAEAGLADATARAAAAVAAAQDTPVLPEVQASTAAEVAAASAAVDAARQAAADATTALSTAQQAVIVAAERDAEAVTAATADSRRTAVGIGRQAQRELDEHHRDTVLFAVGVGALTALLTSLVVADVRRGRRRPVAPAETPPPAPVSERPARVDPVVEGLLAVRHDLGDRLAVARRRLDEAVERTAREQAAVRFANQQLTTALARSAAAAADARRVGTVITQLEWTCEQVASLADQATALVRSVGVDERSSITPPAVEAAPLVEEPPERVPAGVLQRSTP